MKTKRVGLLALLFCSMLSSSVAFAGAKRVNAHMAFDTDVLIISNKTVSFRGECILDDDDGTTRMRLYATTTSATGTVTDGSDDFDGNEGNFLLPTTLPEDAEILRSSVTMGEVRWGNDIDEGFVLDTSGLADKNKVRGLAVDGESAILGMTDDGCYISVAVEKINKFKTKKR